MAYYECNCEKCGHPNDINNSHCNDCGNQLRGTVNTRRASIKSEVEELDKRYDDAINYLRLNGLSDEANVLIDEVNSKGKAVINTKIEFLWEWLVKGSGSYNGYRRLRINNSRPKADFENDVKRALHDSILFGSENDMVYSALSIDEQGLISYGEATLILRIPSIENRTSALETNSYFFIEEASKKGWTINNPLPPGFMSTWFTKYKLSLSKLAKKLKKGIKKDEMARLILTSYGNRSNDEFIELHIFGKIVNTTLEKIKIPSSTKASTDYIKRLRLAELEKKYIIEYY